MTPLSTLIVIHGRRSIVAWGWLCAVNVVLFGITIGALLVIQNDCSGPSRAQYTKLAIKTVEQALIAYQVDHSDTCPKSIDDLYAQHYLTKLPKDAWHVPLLFSCPGVHDKDGADIVSKGRDRVLGTADDIKSWEL